MIPRGRLRITIRGMLLLIALVAVALWARPHWLRYRTQQAILAVGPLSDRDTSAHQGATDAILAVGGGRASVGPLVEALRGDDRGLQFAAAGALGGIGPDAVAAVPALIELLDHPDLYVRQNAPEALGAIGPRAREALPALRSALGDEEWLMRTKAARGIFRIDPAAAPVAIPVMEGLLSDPDPMARSEARDVLRVIGAYDHGSPRPIPEGSP